MSAFCQCVDPATMLAWRRALDLRNEALAEARADRRRVETELATLRVAALHVVSTPPDTPYHRDAVGALRALLRRRRAGSGAGAPAGPGLTSAAAPAAPGPAREREGRAVSATVPRVCWDPSQRILITHAGDDVRVVANVEGHDASRTVALVVEHDEAERPRGIPRDVARRWLAERDEARAEVVRLRATLAEYERTRTLGGPVNGRRVPQPYFTNEDHPPMLLRWSGSTERPPS